MKDSLYFFMIKDYGGLHTFIICVDTKISYEKGKLNLANTNILSIHERDMCDAPTF